MTMVSQVLHESGVVAKATMIPSEPATSTTTEVHSPQTPKASGMNQSNDNSGGNNGSSSSPLLFVVPFIALFTILGIVVGATYCLRRNARDRVRRTDDDVGPITRETVQRPHWRRCEKKLMTMNEVNEKFPMMKYRSWVLERAREGLPIAGDMSVSASLTYSIRDNDGIVSDITAKDRHSNEERRLSDVAVNPAPAATTKIERKNHREQSKPEIEQPATASQTPGAYETTGQVDDDGHLDSALTPEYFSPPGDSCAICIDTLEDDDDIRGLTCGHAFHTVCVDPWLTSRHACCPLCKADYCTPMPRPTLEGNARAANNLNLDPQTTNRLKLPGCLRAAWFRGSNSNSSRQGIWLVRVGGETRSPQANRDQTEGQNQQDDALSSAPPVQTRATGPVQSFNDGMLSSVRQAHRFGRPESNQPTAQNAESTTNETVTPSQLEAANHPAAT